MVNPLTVARTLASAGEVVWATGNHPRLRVAPRCVDPIWPEVPETRAVVRNAVVFRRDWLAAEASRIIPRSCCRAWRLASPRPCPAGRRWPRGVLAVPPRAPRAVYIAMGKTALLDGIAVSTTEPAA